MTQRKTTPEASQLPVSHRQIARNKEIKFKSKES